VQSRIVPQSRLYELVPSLGEGLIGIGKAVERSGLDRKLIELAKIRASQINGCAFCLKMHTADARRLGESEERIYLLDAWREAPCYTEKERAALAWTEAVTRLQGGVPDEVFEEARAQLGEEELANLTAAVAVINAWNRISIAYRFPPQVEARS
jgi:AhpD family alkylhydroperoxidase